MSLSLFTKLITTSRTIKNSGYNKEGQLDNKNENIELFIKEPIVKNIYKMDRSTYHTLYMLNNKKIYGVGYNKEGQLGTGNYENCFEPTIIQLPEEINQFDEIDKIFCGGYHSFILDKKGNVYGCGSNYFGQLGLNENINYNKFTKINSLSNIKNIFCGGYHSFFIDYDNNIYACGKNDYGQLGFKNYTESINNPIKLDYSNTGLSIEILNSISYIRCGGDYSIFITNDNKFYVCGYNGYGQLGTNDYENKNELTLNQFDVNNHLIKDIQCGSHHTLILLEDGNVYGSGSNLYGQLGLGTIIKDSNTFSKLNIENVDSILTDAYTSLFLIDTDNIYGCGHNKLGELGLGDNNHRYEIIKLKYNDIWLDSLSENIIYVSEYDFNKKIFIVDGLFLTTLNDYVILLDKNLFLKVYNKYTMEEIDKIGFYIERGILKYTRDSKYFESEYKNNFTESFYETCNYSSIEDSSTLEFSINNKFFSYNPLNKDLKELFEENEICTNISNDIIAYGGNIFNYMNNTILVEKNYIANTLDINIEEIEILNLTYINGFNENINYVFNYFDKNGYTKVGFFSKDWKIYKPENISKNYEEFIKTQITTILYFDKKIYFGTNSGQLWIAYYVNNKIYFKLLKKFKGGQIISLNIKKNDNKLNKRLTIDNNSRFINIGFSDGRLIKYCLYKEPDIKFDCTGIYFINNKVYYNIYIKIKNFDYLYHSNLRMIVHNSYNEEEILLEDFDSNLELRKTIIFENLENINYSYIRLNYLYGHNSLGSLYNKLSTVKINNIYSLDNKIFVNASNYSSFDLDVVLQTYDINTGSCIDFENIKISNTVDHQFLCFSRLPEDIKYINLITRYDNKEFYLIKETSLSDIELSTKIKQISYDGNILVGFDRLFNTIYENKNIKDIPLEQITSILNLLSHKKYESVRSLENFKIDNYDTENLDKEYLPLFSNTRKDHYIVPSHPKKVSFRDYYRGNIFVNGKKVCFNDYKNSFDRKNNKFISYLRLDKNKENKNIDISMYSESLILSENEIYTIRLNRYENIINELLSDDGYTFTLPITSNYLDEDYFSLYVKFRHGVFWSRINDFDYTLKIVSVDSKYMTLNLKMNNEVIVSIGNEIHLCLKDLDKRNEIIFKNTSKNESEIYKNYYMPLINLDEKGNIKVFNVNKSEDIEIFVNGSILTPYVDYKVVNIPLHLQMPSMILFRHPIKNDMNIEVSILKENYIDAYIKDYRNKNSLNKYQIFTEDSFKPMLSNTFDVFINGTKIPSEYNIRNREFNIIDNLQILNMSNTINFVRFYLEDNDVIKFLIMLLSLKLRDSIDEIENHSSESNLNFDEYISSLGENNISDYFIDTNGYNDGLLYLLFEMVDNSFINNENAVIDCNDNSNIGFEEDILLDANNYFKIPYVTENIKINCNTDYSKESFNNEI